MQARGEASREALSQATAEHKLAGDNLLDAAAAREARAVEVPSYPKLPLTVDPKLPSTSKTRPHTAFNVRH